MNSSFFERMASNLAPERMDAYRRDGASPTTALARYMWNVAVSESLYPTLQFAEIALRNRLHQCLTLRFGTSEWYNDTRCPLQSWQGEHVAAAREELTKAGKPVTPSGIVSELTLGFWTGFFNKSQHRAALAAHLAQTAFSRAPSNEQVVLKLEVRWKKIRDLRNRVFHHERIIHWKDLPSQHIQMLEAIFWLSSELHQVAVALDRFPQVWKQGIDPWLTTIQQKWPES